MLDKGPEVVYNRCICNICARNICARNKIEVTDLHPFMRQINITHRCAMRYREDQLADTGLAGVHTPYLLALYRNPGMSQEEIARYLNVNRSSVTRQLTALEEKGYVLRRSDPNDRRTLLVYPTEKALALQERMHCVLHDWSEYLTADFTAEEKETLSRLMVRIAQRAEDYMKGGRQPCVPSDDT